MQINLFGDIIQEETGVAVEEKASPFTYMTSISNKKYPADFDGYSPFLTNLGFSQRQVEQFTVSTNYQTNVFIK